MRRSNPLAAAAVAMLAATAPVHATDPPPAASTAPATRTILLVRHGYYDHAAPGDEETGNGLVPIGREQAQIVADRLVREGWRVDSLHASALLRARQTADIVGKTLGMTPVVVRDLSECTPATRRRDVMAKLVPGESDRCRAQLERVVARYLRPAVGAEDRLLLVCHGNVIRYLVCRALGVDPEAWLGMRIVNGGITEIEIAPSGDLRLVSFNDVGHLPPDKRTGARPAPTPAPARR